MKCARCGRWMKHEGTPVSGPYMRTVFVGPVCARKLQQKPTKKRRAVLSRSSRGRAGDARQGELFVRAG